MSHKGFGGGQARTGRGSFDCRDIFLQRLYSTFPSGLPGAGLILLRVIVAIPLVFAARVTMSSPAPAILDVVAAVTAVFLLIGLWTPIAGAALVVIELYLVLSHPADPWPYAHFGVLGASLAMLGPGGYSVDARLFGRKQIQIPQR
jgi:putative oxidoreductase